MSVAERLQPKAYHRFAQQKLFCARNVRRTVQLMSLGLFLAFFLATVYPLKLPIPVDAYLRMSLLNTASAMVVTRELILSLLPWVIIVLITTVLLGRIFCGWICPLGVILDITDRSFEKRIRRSAMRERRWRNVKFYLLAFIGVAALFSVQIAFLFDPIALLTRTLTWSFYAPLQLGFHRLGALAGDWLQQRGGWVFPEEAVHFRMGLVAFLFLGLIVAANALSPRFWCRNLCPLGALLNLLSWSPLLRKWVSEACDCCQVCANLCRMQAIDSRTIQTDPRECILCMSCIALCPTKAIHYGLHWGKGRVAQWAVEPSGRTPQPVRRHLIFSGLAGLAWAALARTSAGAKLSVRGQPISSPFLLRPPGSLSEEEFLSRCVRCSTCMKVCPTGGLQPAITEAGLEGFWTPVLVPRMGECAPECTACGWVCPTQAIQPFHPQEKAWLFLGTAVIDRSFCLVWNAQKRCLVCDEVCTYRAVEWRMVNDFPHPFVNEQRCVGCGLCERKCPVQPVAAIRVYSFGDKRSWSREKQKRWRTLTEQKREVI